MRPTQPEVGMAEVDEKIKEYQELSSKDLSKIKVKKISPVIIGPDGQFYLIDRHHTNLALWSAGEKDVVVQIQENWSDVGEGKSLEERMKLFWDQMENHDPKYCYLKLQNGKTVDPLSPSFPKDLKQCGNNPDRALVGKLIDEGVLEKVDIPYSEFYISEILQREGITLPKGSISKDEWKEYEKKADKILQKGHVKTSVQKLVESGPHCDINKLMKEILLSH